MYSDGSKKTLSELQREAELIRNKIADEAQQLERITKAMAKTQFSIDQLFRFFAPQIRTEEERRLLIDVLENNSADLELHCVPLMPVVCAIANGRLNNARQIHTADSVFVDDSSVIFLVHVLRFSPHAAQIDYVDVSGTSITERGLCHLLQLMLEREHGFTLVAKRLSLQSQQMNNNASNQDTNNNANNIANNSNSNTKNSTCAPNSTSVSAVYSKSNNTYQTRCQALLNMVQSKKHLSIVF